MGPGAALVVQVDVVDEPVGGLLLDQIGLHQPPEGRVVLPGLVGETAVPGAGRHVAAARPDADELTGGVNGGGGCDCGFDRHPLG